MMKHADWQHSEMLQSAPCAKAIPHCGFAEPWKLEQEPLRFKGARPFSVLNQIRMRDFSYTGVQILLMPIPKA